MTEVRRVKWRASAALSVFLATALAMGGCGRSAPENASNGANALADANATPASDNSVAQATNAPMDQIQTAGSPGPAASNAAMDQIQTVGSPGPPSKGN
jgi:hypothetical protein